jgi:hypothetical protein
VILNIMFLASQRDMLVMLTESDIDLYIRTLVMLVMLTESDIDLFQQYLHVYNISNHNKT